MVSHKRSSLQIHLVLFLTEGDMQYVTYIPIEQVMYPYSDTVLPQVK